MTKWTEATVAQLNEMVAGVSLVTRELVDEIASKMDLSGRSVSSKLRAMGLEVEKVADQAKSFSEDETNQLINFLEANAGQFTYAEVADRLGTGHTAKAVQGKILSLELTDKVKKTPPKESSKTYTDAEESTVVQMCQSGKFVEEIAAAVDKSVPSVRGKALSLLKAGVIDKMPEQKEKKGAPAHFLEGLDVAKLTVEQIVEATGKTPRGVKTALTRNALKAADYDGAAKASKNAEAA